MGQLNYLARNTAEARSGLCRKSRGTNLNMQNYKWDFSVILSNGSMLWHGLEITFAVTVLSCAFGTLLAIPIASALRSSNVLLRWPATVAVELGKGLPLLVLLVYLQYATPVLLGWSASAFWNAVIAFSINLAAFLADVLRGGTQAIPKGHMEAGQAMGMGKLTLFRRVMLPETVRRTLPTISAFYIGVLKLSTLASVIGVQEMLYQARLVNSESPHPLELYTALAVIFTVLVIPFSLVSRLLEDHPWFALAPRSRK
jgi:polar amino acid transport system permease protein